MSDDKIMKRLHTLKILPEYFEKVISGEKRFEIRKNDRDFKVGDDLILHEWVNCDNNNGYMTGGWITAAITYITDFMQKDDYVVMGIKVYNYQTGFMYIYL